VATSHYFDDLLLGPSEALERAVTRAWLGREGRRVRYEGKKLGGTVVVHFLKKNEWWEEATLALLGGDEYVYSTTPHHPGNLAPGTSDNASRSTAIETESGESESETGTGDGTKVGGVVRTTLSNP
jgi:hypothetical protein